MSQCLHSNVWLQRTHNAHITCSWDRCTRGKGCVYSKECTSLSKKGGQGERKTEEEVGGGGRRRRGRRMGLLKW